MKRELNKIQHIAINQYKQTSYTKTIRKGYNQNITKQPLYNTFVEDQRGSSVSKTAVLYPN